DDALVMVRNSKFAALRPEFFVTNQTHGSTVPLPTSPVDGYAYARAELIYLYARSDTAAPGSIGSLLTLHGFIRQDTGAVTLNTLYFNQDGAQTNTNNGTFRVVTVALRSKDVEVDSDPNAAGGGEPGFEGNLDNDLLSGGGILLMRNPDFESGDRDWTKSAGFINPYVDGVYGDEFMWRKSQIPDFPAYVEAIKRIAANEEFKNKKVHGWTFGKKMYTEPAGKELLQTFIDSGAKIAWEYYAGERDTAAVLRKELYGRLGQTIKGWEKSIPGMVKSIVFTIGNFSAPPHSINSDPHVDFKVHMDEQFNYLANAPECAGLFGIMGYKARYADEEIVRWTGRLFRHYCIEGKRNLLSDELGFKYVPGHITNADFDDGLEDWTVTAAAPDSVRAETISGLSAMLGRFMTPEHGDNHLWTKRFADQPNQVSQEIKNLTPGKLYSAKLYVADYQDYVKGESVRKKLAVSLNIDNVDMITEKCLVREVKGIRHACVGTFKGKAPPWMNHYRLVFRAKGTTAKLTISDWTDETTPGGAIGQEILYNFVEVQPYIED
ncbi:hypothetical protein LCGC14_2226220, partial [marine sediment metagenome]